MQKFLRYVLSNFKEYLLLIVLAVISLSVLAANEKPQAKRLKTFAIGSFSVLNEIATSITSIFRRDDSIAQLKHENAKLMLEVNRLRKAGQENEDLRAMIALKDTSKYPLIPAKVISKLVSKIQGNFIINRGSSSNIKKGMPVLNQKGLIGLISEVSENYSVVNTLESNSLNIAVTIQRINVNGILSYDGNSLVIKNVPSTFDIKVGDRIETSDFSSLFPPAIPIGVILRKESNVYGLLLNLYVQSFVNIPGVDDLFVLEIIPSKEINQLEMNLLK
jgi:rod shape-determining protein MreC